MRGTGGRSVDAAGGTADAGGVSVRGAGAALRCTLPAGGASSPGRRAACGASVRLCCPSRVAVVRVAGRPGVAGTDCGCAAEPDAGCARLGVRCSGADGAGGRSALPWVCGRPAASSPAWRRLAAAGPGCVSSGGAGAPGVSGTLGALRWRMPSFVRAAPAPPSSARGCAAVAHPRAAAIDSNKIRRGSSWVKVCATHAPARAQAGASLACPGVVGRALEQAWRSCIASSVPSAGSRRSTPWPATIRANQCPSAAGASSSRASDSAMLRSPAPVLASGR